MEQTYKIEFTHNDRSRIIEGTLEELIDRFSYKLECGAAYQHEEGCREVSKNPEDIDDLIESLNNAVYNTTRGYGTDYYDYA